MSLITSLYIIFRILYIFSDYGKFATNRGFEKIVYQARMCSDDEKNQSYQGCLAQCAGLYGVVTINKLFQEQYVTPLFSEKLVGQCKSDDNTMKNSKKFEEYYVKYVTMKKGCSAVKFGVTAKYLVSCVRTNDLIH